MTYKNIRIAKRGGGTRLQRVKVLASGKYKFVKNLVKGKTRSRKTRASNPKKKVKKTAKKKKTRRYSMTIPLAPVVGIAAALPIDIAMKGDINGFVLETKRRLTGFDESGGFHWDWLAKGLGPIVAGLLIHKFVGGSPLNLNRMLGRAKVPFLRI